MEDQSGDERREDTNADVKFALQAEVLFGKDSYQPDEFPYFFRTFETNDEYFDYYRDYHAFWKLYGIGLPDNVLKKLYADNARALVPGLANLQMSKR